MQPDVQPAADVEPNSTDGPGDRALVDHGVDGRLLPGNQARRTVGLYARQQPAGLREGVQDFAAGVIADLGGASELSTLEKAYVGRLGDVETTLRLLMDDIQRRGLLTHSGGVRRVYDELLSGIDRWDRLAQRLGLRRRAKQAPTLAEYLEQRAQQQRTSEDEPT